MRWKLALTNNSRPSGSTTHTASGMRSSTSASGGSVVVIVRVQRGSFHACRIDANTVSHYGCQGHRLDGGCGPSPLLPGKLSRRKEELLRASPVAEPPSRAALARQPAFGMPPRALEAEKLPLAARKRRLPPSDLQELLDAGRRRNGD